MASSSPLLEVLAAGDMDMLARPCVDCGVITGRFCDWCKAADRCPDEEWAEGQLTPLSPNCDNWYNECHFCRRMDWVTPPPSQQRTVPESTDTTAASSEKGNAVPAKGK